MSEITQDLSALSGLWIVQEEQFSVGAQSALTQIALRNPLRWGLSFASAVGGLSNVVLTTDPTGQSGQGITLGSSGTLLLSYRLNPAMVQAAWFAYDSTGGNSLVTVIEELAQQ